MGRSIIAFILIGPVICMAADRPTTAPAYILREQVPSLDVDGVGQVSAKPDLAIVRVGAEFQEPQASAAQEKVNQAMTRATQAIKDGGIDAKNIRTAHLNIETVYEQIDENQPRKLIGYRASNMVEVRLSELEKISAVIDAAIGAGANRVEGIGLELKDSAAQRKLALERAAKDGQEKASALAAAMGVKLGPLQGIREGSIDMGGQSLFGGGGGGERTATPVEAGELQITAKVYLSYRIVQP